MSGANSQSTQSPVPSARSVQAVKEAAQRQWSHDPAGALAAGDETLGSPESFARVEAYRYAEQPWMHDTFHYERYAGRDVLEVGVGLGTDHLQFARAGARMTGIDLTPRCVELTAQRVAQEGLTSDLRVMDAESLDFADNSFDVVYSFGVLHHTASAETAFQQIRRVLRPGGVFIGGLYNRHSAFYARVLTEYALLRQWRTESFADRLSRIEHSTAPDAPRPYVRLLTARELTRSLKDAGFADVTIVRRHSAMVPLTRRLPPWVDQAIGRAVGWYLVHEAR